MQCCKKKRGKICMYTITVLQNKEGKIAYAGMTVASKIPSPVPVWFLILFLLCSTDFWGLQIKLRSRLKGKTLWDNFFFAFPFSFKSVLNELKTKRPISLIAASFKWSTRIDLWWGFKALNTFKNSNPKTLAVSFFFPIFTSHLVRKKVADFK